jgi:hypothetical protein
MYGATQACVSSISWSRWECARSTSIGHACCLDDPKADIIAGGQAWRVVGFDRVTLPRFVPMGRVPMILAFLEAGRRPAAPVD